MTLAIPKSKRCAMKTGLDRKKLWMAHASALEHPGVEGMVEFT